MAVDAKSPAFIAACKAFDAMTKELYDEFHATHRVEKYTSAILEAYQSALPAPEGEVARMVERLNDLADEFETSPEAMREAAAMLSDLSTRLQHSEHERAREREVMDRVRGLVEQATIRVSILAHYNELTGDLSINSKLALRELGEAVALLKPPPASGEGN